MRVNYGEWDTYNHSTIAVLDGQTGRKLWSFGSIKTGMMSGLSLASTSLGADAAVFITMGTIEDNNSTARVSYILLDIGLYGVTLMVVVLLIGC